MKLLAFAASHRKDSVNRKLIDQAAIEAKKLGTTIDVRDFCDFDMPIYNDDQFQANGLPEGGKTFQQAIEECDGMIMAVPEYNWSYPGVLKNAIDWVSRSRPIPFNNKHCLLMSASPSMVGGIRGLLHLRVPLEALGTTVHPTMFTLANAYNLFDDKGNFTDNKHSDRLEKPSATTCNLAQN